MKTDITQEVAADAVASLLLTHKPVNILRITPVLRYRQTVKTTLSEYIYSMRVYDAAQLLMKTDLPITQIVSQLGFGSIRNFNRVFLSHTGFNPRDYRKKYATNHKGK